MGYGVWLHGEAVAAGMVMAAKTAERIGTFTAHQTQRIIALLERAELPVTGPEQMKPDDYLPHMMRDKRSWAGNSILSYLPQSAMQKCAQILKHKQYEMRYRPVYPKPKPSCVIISQKQIKPSR